MKNYETKLKELTEQLKISLKNPLKRFDEVKDIEANGIYIVYKGGILLYVGSTTKKGHKRMGDLISFWDNHTLHKKLLKEKLGVNKLIWCKKGEVSPYSKKQLIKDGKFTEEQFKKTDEETIELIKTFKFRFIDMTSKKSKDIKNFEHFTIAVLDPLYNGEPPHSKLCGIYDD